MATVKAQADAMPPPVRRFYGVAEVAELLGLSEPTVYWAIRAVLKVTADVGRTGLTGLTFETQAGASVTVALSGESVDALLEALADAAPVAYLPRRAEAETCITQPVAPVVGHQDQNGVS